MQSDAQYIDGEATYAMGPVRRVGAIFAAICLVVVGAIVFGARTMAHNAVLPTTNAGPSDFTKYGMKDSNNAVFGSPVLSGWAVHWTYKAPVPLQQASVSDGVVYASGDGGNLSGQGIGYVYALGAKTGRLLWRQSLNNMSMTTPVVAEGLVFVGTGTPGFAGSNLSRVDNLNARHIIRGTSLSAIYALNAATGQIVWEYLTRGEDMPTFVFHSGTLYVANGNGLVYAFNAKTGQKEWTVSIGSYVSMSSPTWAHGVLYVSGAHPYDLYAISAAKHALLWKVAIPDVFAGTDDSSLAYSHHRIYVLGTTGGWTDASSVVFAYTAAGQLAWQSNLGSGTLPAYIEAAAPVAVGNTLYVGSPITNAEYALNVATGKRIWAFHAVGPISESPAVLNNRLYFGDSTGMFYVLNASTGRAVATKAFRGSSFAADYPVIVGHTLYQPDDNGEMLARPLTALG